MTSLMSKTKPLGKILLAGASGFIGSHIQAMLTQQGYEVLPISRRDGVDLNQMTTVESWLPYLQNVAAVINAAGIIVQKHRQSFEAIHQRAPSALFRACAKLGVQRVIQISALGADKQAFTPYQLSKKAADDVLRHLQLDWFVLHPSLVYGQGGTSMKFFRALSSLPVIPLVGDGQYKVQPVHINDLLAVVSQCLDSENGQLTIDVVGPEPLAFVDWLQAFRHVNGRKSAPTLSMPFNVILSLARIGRFLLPIMHPDNLRMLQRGNTADVKPMAALIRRLPMSVKEGLCLI